MIISVVVIVVCLFNSFSAPEVSESRQDIAIGSACLFIYMPFRYLKRY